MSRRASPPGNAPAESFSHTLKAGLVHHGAYAARAEAKRGPFSYVKSFCNRQRLHPALDCRTPEQARRQAANIAQTARENRGGSIGNMPSAEAEALYHAQLEDLAMAA